MQTPTMWMDAGNGINHSGDKVSRYTNILINCIRSYLEKNEDVDRKRVYIGGCSNGGYMAMNLAIEYSDMLAAVYNTCEAYANWVYEKDEKGDYVRIKGVMSPTAAITTDVFWLSDEKIEKLKNIPLWIIASQDDETAFPWLFSMPTYRRIARTGAKNKWFSYFEAVLGAGIKGYKYNGHWSWVKLLNDEVTRVQDRKAIEKSMDNDKSYGCVPSNEGGGSKKAVDEKGTYENIFDWMNAQVKA